MSDSDNTAKGNVKICNRNHNHDDWDDGGCCQDAKATHDNNVGAQNQQKKPQ